MVGLLAQQDANTEVVTSSPEEEDNSKDRLFEISRQCIGEENVQAENDENDCIGKVLWFAGIEQLGDHVMGCRDNENCIYIDIFVSACMAAAQLCET